LQDSILLIGIHTRPSVSSAKALGLFTLSVDYFGDVDLKETADVSRSIRDQKPFESSGRLSENYSGEKLEELAADLDADRTVSTCSLNLGRRVTGNPPEKLMKLKDKELQLKKVGKLGVNVPDYEVVDDIEDAREAAEYLGFPCILKPSRGAGGRDVLLVKKREDIKKVEETSIVQRLVKGTPISTSTLSTKKDAMLLSTSEQLLGLDSVGQRGFVYCGNSIPLNLGTSELDELWDLSTRISKTFGVVGWNGIDFVLEDEPVFIEINPRFQGTFDCIERSYNINLLEAHIRACEGELILPPTAEKSSVRMTVFARERCLVNEDLRGIALDVPLGNSIIEKGEPVATIITSGKRREAIQRCNALVKGVYERTLTPWPL
jgi:predicted ATP-grasp superfamily ATP-dependent carboligase